MLQCESSQCYHYKERSGIDIAVPLTTEVSSLGQPQSSHSPGMEGTLAYVPPDVLLSTHKQPIVQGTGAYQASMLLLETALELQCSWKLYEQ